jgi:hypothetical protein
MQLRATISSMRRAVAAQRLAGGCATAIGAGVIVTSAGVAASVGSVGSTPATVIAAAVVSSCRRSTVSFGSGGFRFAMSLSFSTHQGEEAVPLVCRFHDHIPGKGNHRALRSVGEEPVVLVLMQHRK